MLEGLEKRMIKIDREIDRDYNTFKGNDISFKRKGYERGERVIV